MTTTKDKKFPICFNYLFKCFKVFILDTEFFLPRSLPPIPPVFAGLRGSSCRAFILTATNVFPRFVSAGVEGYIFHNMIVHLLDITVYRNDWPITKET